MLYSPFPLLLYSLFPLYVLHWVFLLNRTIYASWSSSSHLLNTRTTTSEIIFTSHTYSRSFVLLLRESLLPNNKPDPEYTHTKLNKLPGPPPHRQNHVHGWCLEAHSSSANQITTGSAIPPELRQQQPREPQAGGLHLPVDLRLTLTSI